MQIKHHLQFVVDAYNLLENPFYQAWSAGTLSKQSLQAYAAEYGNFVSLLPLGWQTLGDSETAKEEREHHALWQQFAHSLRASVQPARYAATKRLVTVAQTLFAKRATALGALYAFEVQQPATALSKREGLQTHYQHLHADEAYFSAHTHNQHEAAKLLVQMRALRPADQAVARQACLTMSRALWDTLVAIHDQH